MSANNKYNPNHLSRDELESFLKGELSDTQTVEVGNKINSNEFYKEAVEGFKSMPGSINSLNKLQKSFSKTKFKFWNTQNFIISILITSITALTIVISNDFTPKINFKNSNNITEKNILTEEDKMEIIEIETASDISENKQIDYIEAVKSQPETIEIIDNKSYEYIQKLSSKGPVAINITDESIINEKPVNNKRYTYSNFPVYYLIDLKSVDYRLVYQNKIKNDEFQIGGLDPKYANPDEINNELHALTTVLYTYQEFLRRALSKFKKNKYKEALFDFRTILKQYPEDMNAHFYGGLCYYNIGRNSKAIEWFDFVIDHYISAFDSEAEWYKAKTLISMNKTDEAVGLLNEIIEKNGFYSKRAKKVLASESINSEN